MNVPMGVQNLTYEETKEILSISMSPGLEQDPTKMGIIEYSFEKYTSDKMYLNVKFENPLFISMAVTPDYMSVQVRNTSYFTSFETGKDIDIF